MFIKFRSGAHVCRVVSDMGAVQMNDELVFILFVWIVTYLFLTAFEHIRNIICVLSN